MPNRIMIHTQCTRFFFFLCLKTYCSTTVFDSCKTYFKHVKCNYVFRKSSQRSLTICTTDSTIQHGRKLHIFQASTVLKIIGRHPPTEKKKTTYLKTYYFRLLFCSYKRSKQYFNLDTRERTNRNENNNCQFYSLLGAFRVHFYDIFSSDKSVLRKKKKKILIILINIWKLLYTHFFFFFQILNVVLRGMFRFYYDDFFFASRNTLFRLVKKNATNRLFRTLKNADFFQIPNWFFFFFSV